MARHSGRFAPLARRLFGFAPRAALLVLVLAGAMVTARAQDAADLSVRLDRLEAENRRLNGRVEELTFQVRRLEDQLRRGGGDGAGAPQPGLGAIRQRGRADVFDPEAEPQAPGAPRPLGAPGPGEGIAGRANGRITAGAVPPGGVVVDGQGPGPVDLSTPPRGGAPRPPTGDYATARAALDAGNFELAETGFRDFLRTRPNDRLVPEALFGLGESLYQRTRYREAAEQFLAVTTQHANAQRAPEAMLRLGMSLRQLGIKDEACGTYAQVTKKYPQAAPAIKQAVERERKRAQCP